MDNAIESYLSGVFELFGHVSAKKTAKGEKSRDEFIDYMKKIVSGNWKELDMFQVYDEVYNDSVNSHMILDAIKFRDAIVSPRVRAEITKICNTPERRKLGIGDEINVARDTDDPIGDDRALIEANNDPDPFMYGIIETYPYTDYFYDEGEKEVYDPIVYKELEVVYKQLVAILNREISKSYPMMHIEYVKIPGEAHPVMQIRAKLAKTELCKMWLKTKKTRIDRYNEWLAKKYKETVEPIKM